MDTFWPTLGVEEEYIIVDPQSREAVADPPPELFAMCKNELGDHVTPEFLRCQIEIATPVCQNLSDVRENLNHMRGTISQYAQKFDLALMAASTHPFTSWRKQRTTKADRYMKMQEDLQGAIRRMLICGMHIHVGIENESTRIDVMNQMRYFLPHMLALSTSSPFWEGDLMGMQSYRLSVFDGMPRTGIPEALNSPSEYNRIVDTLVQVGEIDDASKIWWDLRPSVRFPTLESRITDVCTRMEDALAIVAIYQCLTRMFIHLKERNIKWRNYPAFLISENRWIGQRFGTGAELIDFGKVERIPLKSLIEELVGFLSQHAEVLGCENELAHALNVVNEGSSATRQVKVYEQALSAGGDEKEALKSVVDHLTDETIMDVN